MNEEPENFQLAAYRSDPDYFYREAIRELGRYNDRQFVRYLSRSLAVTVFIFSIFVFLVG